ncbi:MAG TPA: ATP synthase subunit C [Anaerolineaceae bacterium]|jgi:V/A-type H+-transporting ATPase subunit K
MIIIAALAVGMIPIVPAVIYFLKQRNTVPAQAARGLVLGLKGFNVVLGLMALGVGVVWLFSPATVMAAAASAQTAAADPYVSLAAAISTGLACIGAGIAVSGTGAAAIGAIAEKPEAFGRSLIFVGLGEGVAIYGLIIAFLVLNR